MHKRPNGWVHSAEKPLGNENLRARQTFYFQFYSFIHHSEGPSMAPQVLLNSFLTLQILYKVPPFNFINILLILYAWGKLVFALFF